MERTCKACGKVLVRQEGEVPARLRARKFCNYQCSVEFSRRNIPGTKPCVTCGATMTRAIGQAASDWRKQNNCSPSCIRQYQSKRQCDRRTRAVLPPKKCVICGEWFSRRDNESIPTFQAKKACSQACAIELLKGFRKDWPDKTCENCGESFARRNGEPSGNWSRRRTCSIKCGAALLVKTRSGQQPRVHPYPEGWTRSEGKLLKEYIRERDGQSCYVCGGGESSRLLSVHHIDYIKSNLHPANLITLCNRCHAKTNNDRAYWQAYFTTVMAERPDVELAV